jgi:hypothetical protein
MFSFATGIMLVEIVWLVLGVTWLTYHYRDCPIEGAKEAVLGKEQHNPLRGGTWHSVSYWKFSQHSL